MFNQEIRNRFAALLLGLAALALSGTAQADPPTRVARLGYISGAMSFSPAGENDWVNASSNRPLTTGDRLWATPQARAELQIGAAAVRINGSTSVTLLNLDDSMTQLKLEQGTLNLRLRSLGPNQVFEIDTPNLAFSLLRTGSYRIEVNPEVDRTTVLVRDGEAEVYGEGAAYRIDQSQAYSYYGTGLRDYEFIGQPAVDEFDRWSSDRDLRAERSASLRYVSPDVIGYEDLDAHGAWRTVPAYGNVWVPIGVAPDWAPYRDGHWAWVEPWGWTWVDDAPWGFAVSHYGRWANLGGTWAWVPGPVHQQAVYAPALVAFVGGNNFRLSVALGNVGGIAWFALGPRDVYRPSYPVSRDYFTRVNSSNTVINNVNIVNQYNNVTNITYVNRQVPGAVVAVPRTAFVQSQPLSRVVVRLNAEQIVNAPISAVAAVAPVQRSVTGAAAPAVRPAVRGVDRPFVARTAPPPAPVAFAVRESALTAAPGKPLAPAEVQRLKPAAAAVPAAPVVVTIPVRPAVPMATAAPSRPEQGRASRGEAVATGQRGRSEQTFHAPNASVQPQLVPQPPITAPAEQRTAPGQRSQTEPQNPAARQAPAAPPIIKPQAAPQSVPQPPLAAPLEQRAPPSQRGRSEPPAPAAAVTPPTAPQAQSSPATAPLSNAQQRGPDPKPKAHAVENKRTPEQIRQDEQQRHDEEKKGHQPN